MMKAMEVPARREHRVPFVSEQIDYTLQRRATPNTNSCRSPPTRSFVLC